MVAPSLSRRRAWGVVVPVKRLPDAKTRLAPLGPADRRGLALAFAQDSVRAARAAAGVAQVLVVTDDPDVTTAVEDLGASVTPDPGGGIDGAVVHGASVLRDGPLGGRAAVAALAADLPAVRPEDLAAVLEQAGRAPRGCVTDHTGLGTTLLCATGGRPLLPSYGVGSAAAHVGSGAVLLDADARLRLDVDTPADLAAALRLGVGPATAQAVAALAEPGWGAGRSGATSS